jgi:hypothetical protein
MLFAKSQTETTAAERRAALLDSEVKKLLSTPRALAESLLIEWERSSMLLWGTRGKGEEQITAADRFARIGTDGKELLEESRALVTFLIGRLTAGGAPELVARLQRHLASLPAFTEHEDGTVTVN